MLSWGEKLGVRGVGGLIKRNSGSRGFEPLPTYYTMEIKKWHAHTTSRCVAYQNQVCDGLALAYY